MWIVRLALRRPYTFMVMAILIAILGGLSIVTTPTDIFPYINIPMVGVIWTFVNGYDMRWRSDKRALYSYDLATLAAAVIFFGRFVVQRWLYDQDHTGWLAFARIAMGYPLTAVALIITVWAVTRAGHRQRDLQQVKVAQQETDAEIEARLRAKYSEPATES